MSNRTPDDELLFTVATVWREERVSCPHPDVLRAHLAGALDESASDFVAFHLAESLCPFCNAIADEIRADESPAAHVELDGVRTRLLRSTVTALRRAAGS